MVTRTITTSTINVKLYNPETDNVEEVLISKPGKLSPAEAEKTLTKEGSKVLKINSIEYDTKLTAMSDEEWMLHSHEIPARNQKAKD